MNYLVSLISQIFVGIFNEMFKSPAKEISVEEVTGSIEVMDSSGDVEWLYDWGEREG